MIFLGASTPRPINPHGGTKLFNETSLQEKAVELLGKPAPTTKPTKKQVLMKYNQNGVYLGLSVLETFDKEKQEYNPPKPKITFLVNGKYVNAPIDYHWLVTFGNFCLELAETIKGVDLHPNKVSTTEARQLLLSAIGGDSNGS